MKDTLPFYDLNEDQFQDAITSSKFYMNDQEFQKLTRLNFHPFSTSGRGKEILTINTDLDPDINYYNQIIHRVDECDYNDEETFKNIIPDNGNVNFSIIHLNIRSIVNKWDDALAYLDSLNQRFSVIGLTETWLRTVK